jgi:hypothetical protein
MESASKEHCLIIDDAAVVKLINEVLHVQN